MTSWDIIYDIPAMMLAGKYQKKNREKERVSKKGTL
jgi:hypothetical protein